MNFQEQEGLRCDLLPGVMLKSSDELLRKLGTKCDYSYNFELDKFEHIKLLYENEEL